MIGVVFKMYSVTYTYNDSYNLLYQLWKFSIEGVPSEFRCTYNCVRREFICTLSNDVKDAISFFNNLDLNQQLDAYAWNFKDSIIENLKTSQDKEAFKNFISTLSQKYPNSPYVDWRAYQFNDSSSSLDDESLSNDSDAESTDGEDECD